MVRAPCGDGTVLCRWTVLQRRSRLWPRSLHLSCLSVEDPRAAGLLRFLKQSCSSVVCRSVQKCPKNCLPGALTLYHGTEPIIQSMESDEAQPMTIGSLAKAAGVGVETIRFYQRKGLLDTPERTDGFRKYSNSHLRIIRFVKRVQELGFSLKDAADLLDLKDCCSDTRPRLAEVSNTRISEIQRKIADLNKMMSLLQQFSNTCGTRTSDDSQCSLIDCFENNWECCET